MPAPQRTDQVYPLSLTELAFVVIFLILLLTGWMVVSSGEELAAAQRQRDEALARTAELSSGDALERLQALDQSLRQTQAEIKALLADSGARDPDGLLSELVRRSRAEADSARLRQRVEDLDAQLSASQEIRKQVEAAAGQAGTHPGAVKEQIVSALEFKRALEQAAGEPVPPRQEQQAAQDYAAARRELSALRADGRSGADIARENQDLRGQMAWLRQRLEANGGRDYPPCWADPATGKPQYLFTIVIQDGGLRIEAAWPPERATDAERLPGIGGLAGVGPLSLTAFQARTRPLDADSRERNCRHYVRLVNHVRSLDSFNRYRYAVEEFFYKFEVR
jgi:hypothetical protein